MHRNAWYLAAMPLVAVATPAVAGEPYYFQKAGVAPEAYVRDVAACRDTASAQADRVEAAQRASVDAAASVQLLAGFLNSRNEREVQLANVSTCMAGKGYARVVMDETAFRKIRMLESNDARLEALFALAAANEAGG